MMQKGIYIGHHCGEPVNIKIVDKFNIIISAKDPDTIIWSFVYKYVLTILTIGSEFLHLKAGAVTYHDGAILIAGRGGGGKTTMIDRVCDENIRYMGNTHIIYNDLTHEIMGIDTNIKVREGNNTVYKSTHQWKKNNCILQWKKIKGIFWINHQKAGGEIIRKMNVDELFYCMNTFSEAINTWELHEDIFDYINSDPFQISYVMKNIECKLRNMINEVEKVYFSIDINSIEMQKKVKKIIKSINLNAHEIELGILV